MSGASPAQEFTKQVASVIRQYVREQLGPRLGSQLDELVEGLAAETRKRIKEATAPLERKIADLESRVPEYRGIWRAEDTPYRRGAMVTLGGSIWHSNVATNARPGTNSDWTLAVKHG